MTYVSTPSSGALREKRPRKFGTAFIAVAITVAAGAAIAVGLSIAQDQTVNVGGSVYTERLEAMRLPAPAESVYTERLEAMRLETPAVTGGAKHAGHIHRGRTPALETQAGVSHGEFVQDMVEAGLVPAGAIPTGTPEITIGAGTPQTGLSHGEFVQDMVEAGLVPSGAIPTGTTASATGTSSPQTGPR